MDAGVELLKHELKILNVRLDSWQDRTKRIKKILVDFGGKICMFFNPGLGVSLL